MSKNKQSNGHAESNNNYGSNGDTNTNDTTKKRLVIVTGDKGGVGKSTFARALLDFYITHKLSCIGYDADARNPQLERHFSEKLVRCVNIFERGGADTLLTDLDKERLPLLLLDLPAQSGGYFTQFESEMSFFDSLAEIGYRVTMASVLNRVVDSVNVLNVLQEYCQDRVDYVIVKNLFYSADDGTRFERYNAWSGRQKLLDKGAKEIEMRDLFYKTYDFVDKYSIPFSHALTHEGSDIAIKGRMKSWIADFDKNLHLASDYLGLNTPPMTDEQYEKTIGVILAEMKEKKKNIAEISNVTEPILPDVITHQEHQEHAA